MPVTLYAIILLLLSNIFTGGMWLYNRSEVGELENKLKATKTVVKDQKITADVKLTEANLVEKTCEQQLVDLKDSYEKAQLRNEQIDNILSNNKRTIKNYHTTVSALDKKIKTTKPVVITKIKEVIKTVPGPVRTIMIQPPTVTFEGLSENEKHVVKEYLNTPVPEFIADSLYIRGVREDQ